MSSSIGKASPSIAYGWVPAAARVFGFASGANEISLGSTVELLSLTTVSFEQAQNESAAAENKNNFFIIKKISE
jgi:hypothetical protein